MKKPKLERMGFGSGKAAEIAMKVGSVQFFKRLIVDIYVLLIIIPVVAAIILGLLYIKEKNRADALQEATLAEMAELLNQSQLDGTGELDLSGYAHGSAQVPSFGYQTMYPDLYANRPLLQVAEEKVCYLTFDDGPSATVTKRILATLAEHDIKATFFVTGRNSELNEDVLREAALAGHTIGVHTYSHEYTEVYSSVEAYLEDFNKMYTRILDVTGAPPEIFRFPGGSINVHNQKIYTQIIAEMTRRGFVFYDWNAAASDAVRGGLSQTQVYNNVMQSAEGQERLVVLMHDRADNGTTAAALPDIIEGLEKQGYRFERLTNTVEPVTYYYNELQIPQIMN